MSTFPGPLEEIENVSVDRFCEVTNSTVYFLSHHHSDHMEGLKSATFLNRLRHVDYVYLYCSPLTKVWLNFSRFDLDHKIKELPINSEIQVRIPNLAPGRDPYLTVTTLSAGHCPGSIMFLFNWESKHILYTGDIRMDAEDMKNMDPLKSISLDTLYLDTTFYSPSYRYLPSRTKSMDRLVAFCKDWLDQNKENVIDIRRSALIGIEYVYIHLYEKLGTRIHVTGDEWQKYGRIPDLAKALTTDENVKVRIHACVGCRKEDKMEKRPMEKLHPKIEFKNIRSVKLCALSAKNLRENDDILSYNHMNDMFKLVYSSHCSHDELREIVAFLSPKKLVPCVVVNVTKQEIIDTLRPNMSPVSLQTSSFESTFDLSPRAESSEGVQLAQNCSQTSITSISSTEESCLQTSSGVPSKRYAIPDSSDDEINLTPPKSETSNRKWAWTQESPEEKPWTKYMQGKKVRRY